MPTLELDYSFLPSEVTDYAAEQLKEGYSKYFLHEAASDFDGGMTVTDYNEQTLTVRQNPFQLAFQAALQEALSAIYIEVKNGEREDYSLAEIEEFEQQLREMVRPDEQS
jgi:hypothetical protein